MTNFHFKCHFPEGYFDTIPIKLRIGDKFRGRIFSGREKTIEVDNQSKKISLRVHQHHVKLFLESDNSEDRYFIIKWKGENSFQRYIYALGICGFQILEVDEEKYDSFNYRIYSSAPKADVDIDKFSLVALAFLSCFFGYQSVFYDNLTGNITEYSLFLCIIGLTTVMSVYFDRKSISLLDASLRIFSNSLLQLVLVIWLAWESYEGTWLLFLPVIALFIRSGLILPSIFRKSNRVNMHEE